MNSKIPEEVRPYVIDTVKNLIESLKAKRAAGTILGEEELVLSSLENPDRGDVPITYLESTSGREIFVGNRRDPDNPYAIMDYEQMRRNTGRRPLFTGRTPSEKESALFLISQQDRDLLNSKEVKRYDEYSALLGLSEQRTEIQVDNRKVTELDNEEKFKLYRSAEVGDSRVRTIEQELFEYSLSYASYGQSSSMKILKIEPGKEREKVGMITRDIYPLNLRSVLRKDFPKDHKEKARNVLQAVRTLRSEVQSRLDTAPDGQYRKYLNNIIAMCDEINREFKGEQ